jgi:hypothetical protein
MGKVIDLNKYRKPQQKPVSVATPELRAALLRINKLMKEINELASEESTCSAPRI